MPSVVQKQYQQVLQENRQLRKAMEQFRIRENKEDALNQVIAEQLAEIQK